ncbi:snaclec macrovipecetin subunit beta-like [Saccoglossus kowalevskii]|uniref:C-type lectin lectoxin-Lio2-like n=1 Tax=Saccoglossus kowalevskii TaxID=10224 RepID=A0ABM0MKC8_SACKO|nr:PREDICTED: C-type lectin lectoxin-Lio2-like [Saccoglossus kowalevskii]
MTRQVMLFILIGAMASPVLVKSACLDGWSEYLGHCYGCMQPATTWEHADYICKNHFGYLASIHTLDENEFVAGACSSDWDLWIGFNKKDDSLTWQWSDGTDLVYTNWEEGQPDGESSGLLDGDVSCAMQKNEAVVGSGDQTWEDEDCLNEYYFVCKAKVL